ncbi:MAG: hypothetical protein ACOX3V_04160 [Bacillota bacterium]|jgi:hypothetical protein
MRLHSGRSLPNGSTKTLNFKVLLPIILVAALSIAVYALVSSRDDPTDAVIADAGDKIEAFLGVDSSEEEKGEPLPLQTHLSKRTSYDIDSISQDENGYTATVTLSAPSITEGLMELLESEEELSEEQIEETVLSLLEEAPIEQNEFILPVVETPDGMEIVFTEEFTNALSGGLMEFIGELYQSLIDELLEEGT